MRLLKENEAIVMHNELTDCRRIVLRGEKFYFDHFSPRENITFEQYEVSTEKAWDFAAEFTPAQLGRLLLDMRRS